MKPVNDITIVTAFFDIGRSTWTQDKGLPHYLFRTNETYIERFKNLTNFDNKIVLFTSSDLVDTIKSIIGDKKNVKIIVHDYHNTHNHERVKIAAVQQDPKYQAIINPYQIRNPEYWSPDYVLVNLLKSYFVTMAIKEEHVDTELAAWVDFGYCRDMDALYNKKSWKLDFDPNKIHLFYAKLPDMTKPVNIVPIIQNNDVHMIGGSIVGGKHVWRDFCDSVKEQLYTLLDHNLVDDDQTIMLMTYLKDPKKFEVHPLDREDSLVVFKQYNNSNY